MWVDESGFYLLPAVVRTYAPQGRTPILEVPLSSDHLSVISAMTSHGQLLLKKQARAYCSDDIVQFLNHLLRYIPGKLLVIWDGSPIHRGQAVKDFLSNGGAQRLHLEQLPSYAPELNPDEGIWRYLKRVEMKNMCCHNLLELQRELRLATMRLRHKRDIIKNCIQHAGLEL